MSEARARGYVTELPYVVRYHRELNPWVMRFALALNGIAWGNDDGAYDYIELGCGFGLSALANAAGNPNARIVGVDINPEHMATAQGIAAAAELPNIRFIEAAFAELEEKSLGAFDVIALHGVWSWIDGDGRGRILEFVDRHLRPGGLMYVSYNTLPGLAPALPLRELMLIGHDQTEGALGLKVDAGVKFAEKVRSAGAAYFAVNPRAAQTLDHILPKSRNALAHEYFNADWWAFYQREVAGVLADIGLVYGGSAHILDNIDPMNYSAAGRELIAQTTPERRETLKDFLANREFRRDIFIRPPVTRGDPDALFAATRFASAGGPQGAAQITGHTALGKLSLKTELAVPALTVLAQGAASAAAILAHPACAGLPRGELMETLLMLVALGGADPALPDAGYDVRKAATGRLNAVLWEAALSVDVIHAAVSPVTAGGIGLGRIEQLFLLARERGEEPVQFIKAVFGDNIQGDVVSNYAQFMEKKLPVLKRLGIG